MTRPLRFALAAGEASGDTLGAGLIEALRAQVPDAEFVGMAGPKMIAAGCEPWYRAEEIAVMGFFEVLPHLRRILALRRELIARIETSDVDVFIGIDAQDFNRPARRCAEARGHQDRAIREPASLGVAAVACRDDSRRRRPRALRAAVRAEVL